MTCLRQTLIVLAILYAVPVAWAAPISDPLGDVFDPGTLTSGPGHPDIVSYSGEWIPGPNVYQFSVTFATTITAPSVPGPNSITGFLEFDTDSDTATGTPPFINDAITNGYLAGPPINLGVDFFVDLISEAGMPGFVDIIDTNTFIPTATVPIAFGPNGFSLTIPEAVLTPSVTLFNYGIYAGNVNTFAGDRAPNGAVPAIVTPEPTSLTLFGLAITGVGVAWCRRRRSAV
jgi:hypothetical protein